MRWTRPRLRFRLSTMGVLVALCALGTWAALFFLSPTRRLIREIQAGQPTYLRREAVGGLGYVPFWEAEEAIGALIGALDDPSPRVRENALAGLGAHGTRARRAIPAIMRSSSDTDRHVRYTTFAVLGAVLPAEGGGPERETVVNALKQALDDPDLENRLVAAVSLLRLRETRAALPTIALAATRPGDQYLGAQARAFMNRYGTNDDLIAGVVPLVQSEDQGRRERALDLLLEIAPPATVNAALRDALQADDPKVRAWATARLESLAPSLGDPTKDPGPHRSVP